MKFWQALSFTEPEQLLDQMRSDESRGTRDDPLARFVADPPAALAQLVQVRGHD